MRRLVTGVCIGLIIFGTVIGAMANSTSEALVAEGRGLVFNNGNPTYQGIVDSMAKFQAAFDNDATDQVARLFLAASKLAVFGLENGTNPAIMQTFRDLYEAFGVSRTTAESIWDSPISEPPTVFDEYDPPETMPNGDELQAFLAGPFLDLVNEVIGYVDGVTDQAIVINLLPEELGDTIGIEIDYGDVLLLRSSLYTLKAFVLLIDSYKMDGLNLQELAVLINADVLQLQRDIFARYEQFLHLKQTDPVPISLSQSKTELFTGINTWQAAYDFIVAETDPQEDDLFAFGSEEEREDAERTLSRMADFKTSLDNNQPMEFVTREIEWELTNTDNGSKLGFWVEIEDGEAEEGHVWGIDGCDFLFCNGGVNDYSIDGNQITIELETYETCGDHMEILTATLTGTLNESGDQIISGTYSKPLCGGQSTDPLNFTGVLIEDETEIVKMDFNRIFGYGDTDPVNVGDVLPQFDADDEPIPSSFSEPILGGFFPDVTTNDDATVFFELQPSGPFTIQTSAISVDGNLDEWALNALLHEDISGDNESGPFGSDIEKVYLAKDGNYLYVGMTLHDGDPNPAVIYGIGFWNWADDGYMPLKTFAAYDTNSSKWIAGLEQWGGVVFADSDGAAEGTNCIEWRIPLSEIEIPSRLENGSLSGKFVSTATVLAATGDELDFNETRIQLDPTTLTGNFTCPYDGTGKIFFRVVGEDDPRSNWEFGSTWVDGSTSGTYTINGLPAGQEVYVYAIWDKDDNGVITYPDYLWGTDDESPLTIQPVTNNLDINITDSILEIVGPFEVIGSLMNVHQPDGSFVTIYSVCVDKFVFGDLYDGVTGIVVKDPDGNIVLTKDDFDFDDYGTSGEFYVIVPGEPLLGTYTFEVTAGGLQAEPVTDTQEENVTIPVPDISSFVPADGAIVDSLTPIFSWNAVDFENACYRLTIDDEWGNRVYATGRVEGMLSTVVPKWKLIPGKTYYWRIRVTDSENWEDVQNRANSEWISFTMAETLSHDATPAIDLDGYGVATWSDENGILALDFWVKVIDQDGIVDGSHSVVITFPDGLWDPIPMNYDSAQNPTSGYYTYWFNLNETQLLALRNSSGVFSFTVTDPAGNQGEATEILTVNPLDALDESTFSITPNGTTPTFNWDNNVLGANTYRVRIYTDDLSRTVYRGSVGDVGEHTVPPGVLEPNTTYRYRIDARDGHFSIDVDNVSRAPASRDDYIQFTTGNETAAPYIDCITSGVETWNHPDAGHIPSFWFRVYDAQGVPGNIRSVKVRFPDYETSRKEETLYFDYNESATCGIYQGESFLGMQSGSYTFVVEDNDGNITEKTEQLDVDCLTPPVDWRMTITPNVAGDGTGFDFVWDSVETDFDGFYRLEIYNRNYNRLYTFATLDNHYELAPGFLEAHELYRFRVTARREFFDQNVDNGASMPWGYDDYPTRVAVPLTGGSSLPTIDLDSWGAVLYHYPDPTDGSSTYRLGFSVKVSDSDGVPENIQSVTVSDGTDTWHLNYDSEITDTEAWYWLWFEISNPADYNGKNYAFTVTDTDSHSAQVDDTLVVDVLDIPAGLKPADGSLFYGTSPRIQWNPVEGASIYRARIYDGLWDTLHKGSYVEQPSYVVPQGVLDFGQIFSYRIRACREDFRLEGIDLDNLSCSELLATGIQPHVTTRELDLGGSILSLQTLSGMAPENINTSADVSGDGKIGQAEAVHGLQKEAGLR